MLNFQGVLWWFFEKGTKLSFMLWCPWIFVWETSEWRWEKSNFTFMLCFLGVHVKNFRGVVTVDPFYYHPDIHHYDHHDRLGNLCRGVWTKAGSKEGFSGGFWRTRVLVNSCGWLKHPPFTGCEFPFDVKKKKRQANSGVVLHFCFCNSIGLPTLCIWSYLNNHNNMKLQTLTFPFISKKKTLYRFTTFGWVVRR